MKKIFLFLCVLMILLTGCSSKSHIITQNNKINTNNNIIYNNAYSYDDEDLQFLIKERGYEYQEEYNNKSQIFSKKELLSLANIKNEDILSDDLFYEIYLNKESENFLIRGPLYEGNSDNQYFSNLVIRDSISLSDKMIVKIIKDDLVVKEFYIEKVVE